MSDMLLSIDPDNFTTEIANIINGANDGVVKAIRRDLIEPLRVQIAASKRAWQGSKPGVS
jgi:hypothetical protein